GELFSGLQRDPREVLSTGFQESHREMVILKNIPFYSLCEHHFLPFHGQAHVGYVPDGRIVGASKIARAVDILARRPQMQERLTGQIADAITESLSPDGVAVVMEAEHLCMTMRGVRKPGTTLITSAIRGAFRRRAARQVKIDGEARALPTVEVLPKEEYFFDFESRYEIGKTEYVCPADLPDDTAEQASRLAIETYRLLGCYGFARVDMILGRDGRLQVLEAQAIPGLTDTSLLPQAAEAAGIPFEQLVERMLDLALARPGTPAPV
ncbi:hypothetical protein LCGC14_2475620, partial [marine sediment metagenome]